VVPGSGTKLAFSREMVTTNPTTILIADDDLLFARSVQILLEDECGCEVVLCSSAADAMDLLDGRRSFDLVIVDLGILDSGEPVLGRLIRHEQDGVRVVVMTAHHAVLDAARERHVGAAAFLGKPIDPAVLLEVVLSVVVSGNHGQSSQSNSNDQRNIG
jgi:DNA-binding NtrC family response regulator